MKKILSRTWVLLGGITVLGLLLRLINIGTQPYWVDEILSLDIVRHVTPISEMLRYLSAVEFHPPLYYVMLRGWTDVFGISQLATRSLSLLFSILTIPLVYLFGTRLFRNRRVGLFAALITAVLPMGIQYAQEARPYAIFCFFGVLSALCAWEWLRGGKKAYVIGYVLSSVVGLYLHYSYFFILGATCTWWLVEALREEKGKKAKALVRWFGVHAAIFFGFLPWLPSLIYKISLGNFTFAEQLRNDVPGRAPDIFFQVVQQLVWLSPQKTVLPIEMLGMLVFLPLLGWSVYVLIRARRTTGTAETPASGAALGYVAWLLFVPLILFIFSPQSRPYTRIDQRHVIFCAVPVALLLALVVSRLSKKMAAVVLAVFLISLIPFVTVIVGDDSQWDADYSLQSVGAYIRQNAQPGDIIIVPVSIMRVGLAHYLPENIPILTLRPFDFYGNDIWSSRHTMGIIENEAQVRIESGSTADVWTKMGRLDAQYRPKRIWLFDFTEDDQDLHSWFAYGHWRRAFGAIGTVFPVYLYTSH